MLIMILLSPNILHVSSCQQDKEAALQFVELSVYFF